MIGGGRILSHRHRAEQNTLEARSLGTEEISV